MGSEAKNPEISITPPEAPGFTLSKEFLEIAFDREVERFSSKPGTNPGDNFLSVMHAIDVVFKGDETVYYYMLKCYPNHHARRDFLDQINVFEKELFVYNEFLPKLNKLAMDWGAREVVFNKAPSRGGNSIGIPSKFKIEPWANENFILMTDIRKTYGYEMADRMKGITLDHAHLVLKEMAKLHALSWAYKKRNNIKLLTDKYPCFLDNMYNNTEELADQFKSLMDSIAATAITAVEEALGESHPAVAGFKKFIKTDSVEFFSKLCSPEGVDEDHIENYLRVKPAEDKNYVKDPWLLLNHGDCWVNNFLFIHDKETKKPTKITMVDFQVFRECCPTLDLAYFMFCSIRAPLRNANLAQLLRVYYDAFLQYCEALGVEPMASFTFENLQRRYRRAELFGLMICLPLLNIVLKPAEESTDLDKEVAEDMAEMFSSVMKGSENNSLFKCEITATVLKLYEDGTI